jgi:hypothetical protein
VVLFSEMKATIKGKSLMGACEPRETFGEVGTALSCKDSANGFEVALFIRDTRDLSLNSLAELSPLLSLVMTLDGTNVLLEADPWDIARGTLAGVSSSKGAVSYTVDIELKRTTPEPFELRLRASVQNAPCVGGPCE